MAKSKKIRQSKSIRLLSDSVDATYGIEGILKDRLRAGQCKVDYNGHCMSGKYVLDSYNYKIPRDWCSRATKCESTLNRLKSAHNKLKAGVRLWQPIKIEAFLHNKCPFCEQDLDFRFDGSVLKAKRPCKYSHGIPCKFELNVPSGKIVVKDDLHRWFNIYGDYNINHPSGTIKTILAMAKIGCAHCYVGNSCPGIYERPKGRYFIVSPNYHSDDPNGNKFEFKSEKCVAGVCTDLWWTSMVDYDEFKKRSGIEPKDAGAEVFDVTPGVYRFQYYRYDSPLAAACAKAYPNSEVYASFERVRKPDPVVDLTKEQREMNLSAGQIIWQSMQDYPFLYGGYYYDMVSGKQKKMTYADQIKGVVDHMFTAIGGGGSWHPNGFLIYNPETNKKTPSVRIPNLNKPFAWYPASEGYCALAAIAQLPECTNRERIIPNKSFLKLAFQVAISISKFGYVNSTGSIDKKQTKSLRDLASRCLKSMAKLYPAMAKKMRVK